MDFYLSDNDGLLYFRKNNLWFRVHAVMDTVQNSNNFMEENPNMSVLYVRNPYVVIVDERDLGKNAV